MTLKIDVLPAPLRPMMPHRSPSATVKVMFLKSSSAPNEMPTLETESRVTEREQKTNKRQRREARWALANAGGRRKLNAGIARLFRRQGDIVARSRDPPH